MLVNEPYWYLASYPKSGNTWCRAFITELLRLKNKKITNTLDLNNLNTGSILSSSDWIDEQIGIDINNLHYSEIDNYRSQLVLQEQIFKNSKRYFKVHDSFFIKETNKPIVPINNCKGALIIIRHPTDIAASLSNFFNWDIPTTIKFLTNKEACLVGSEKRRYSQVRQYLGTWGSHVKGWLSQNLIPILLVKYEELIKYPFDNFLKISIFLELTEDHNLIRKAIEGTKFSNLQKLEEINNFFEKPKNCSKFFFKGKSGEGKKILSRDQFEFINQKFSSILRELNY